MEKTLFGSMAESSLTMVEGPVFWLDKRLELQPGLGYEGTTADTWMNATLGFFEGQRKLAREYYAVDPEFAESYAGKVAGAVGAAVPQLVAMRVPVAAVVGIGGQSFLHAWEDAENTAMRRGEKFDPNRAYAYATTMAALNTALIFLEFDKVLGPWRKGQSELLGDNLIKLFQSATGAGAVNAVQGGVNDLGATAFGIETRNPFDPERRWDDFTVGTGAGIVLGAGAGMALADIPETPPQRPSEKPGITFVDSLGNREVPLIESGDQNSIKTSGSSEVTSINEGAAVHQMKEAVPPNVLLSGSENSSALRVMLRSSKDSDIAYSVRNSPESGGLFTLEQFGNEIASNRIALRFYRELQESGVNVWFYSKPDAFRGYATPDAVMINTYYAPTLYEAVSTLIHEAKHIALLRNTGSLLGKRGVLSGEYSAYAVEFLYKRLRRPVAAEREEIRNFIKEYYNE